MTRSFCRAAGLFAIAVMITGCGGPQSSPLNAAATGAGAKRTQSWIAAAAKKQSLLYVSLATGMVVSVTQTGTEQMDVTLTSNHNTSMRYSGTIASRSQVALVVDDTRGK